ncbi:MAG: hypothetical protein PHY56_00155 [Candidatus Omnitrophica bacterium]|nr:hypothetical protein [Candidatus Omnitrophota bacterium]
MSKRANKWLKGFNQAVKVGVTFVSKKALKLLGVKRKYKTPRAPDTAKRILATMYLDVPESRETITAYLVKCEKTREWLIGEKALKKIQEASDGGQGSGTGQPAATDQSPAENLAG